MFFLLLSFTPMIVNFLISVGFPSLKKWKIIQVISLFSYSEIMHMHCKSTLSRPVFFSSSSGPGIEAGGDSFFP